MSPSSSEGSGRLNLAALDRQINATYHATANGDNNISPGAPRRVQVSLRAAF